MSYTPFQAPILGGLLGDDEIAAQFSVKAELSAMLRFETGLARACALAGLISGTAADAIEQACAALEPDVAAIREATARDGVAVPELVRQIRAGLPAEHNGHVHLGATSQDVIDTALVLRLVECRAILARRIAAIAAVISGLDDGFGARPLMARTRMQAALEITVSYRLASWRKGLETAGAALDNCFDGAIRLQLGGPVGDRRGYGDRADAVTTALADALGIPGKDGPWQTDRITLVQLVSALASLAAALGKMGSDLALMAQNEIGEVSFASAGASSAMPHKQNPVLAETLVTLAQFIAMLAGGMHHAGLHEQERSGAAWSLEWMILPQAVVATGAAARNCLNLLQSVERLGKP